MTERRSYIGRREDDVQTSHMRDEIHEIAVKVDSLSERVQAHEHKVDMELGSLKTEFKTVADMAKDAGEVAKNSWTKQVMPATAVLTIFSIMLTFYVNQADGDKEEIMARVESDRQAIKEELVDLKADMRGMKRDADERSGIAQRSEATLNMVLELAKAMDTRQRELATRMGVVETKVEGK